VTNNFLWYHRDLKDRARYLRNNPTNAEQTLWTELKNDKLGFDFHRQKPIGYYIFDFYCKELSLVIEIDGAIHDLDEVKQNDLNKDDYIKGLNLNILRFTNDEVLQNLSVVIKKIKDYMNGYLR
jgi:very-short-patch-repair endonuclease